MWWSFYFVEAAAKPEELVSSSVMLPAEEQTKKVGNLILSVNHTSYILGGRGRAGEERSKLEIKKKRKDFTH